MNLAQLIDPERAREGFGKPRPAKPAPLPAMGVVVHVQGDESSSALESEERMKHGRRIGIAAELRTVLGAEGVVALSMAQIVAAAGSERMPSEIHSALYGLLGNGDVIHNGPRDARFYTLTPKGRAKL